MPPTSPTWPSESIVPLPAITRPATRSALLSWSWIASANISPALEPPTCGSIAKLTLGL